MAQREPDDQASFRRLFDAAYRPLLAYALRRAESGADAEEVVADTLLVAWRRREQMPGGAETIPWLYGVAGRVLANQRRARNRRRRLHAVLVPLKRPDLNADESVASAGAARALVAAMRRLSESDQEVLRLAFWEGLSRRQIAISLACSENAATVRLHRARQRLRDELLKEGPLPGQEVVEVSQ
jgi:RNA polymerase sigma-70 factor (ECF subfamily)